MKQNNKPWATIGLALSIVGFLTGCETLDNGATALGNRVGNNTNTKAPSVSTLENAASPPNRTRTISISGKGPAWLIHDLKLAAEVHVPLTVQTYALNWNATPHDNAVKPFDAFSETKDLWMAGYTGDKRQKSYVFYAGTYDVKGLYASVKKGTQLFTKAAFIYMLESGSKSGGVGHLVPAISIDLGNGEFMAFSSNQIITRSEHSGFDQYVVYPVQGIQLPNE